MSNVTGSKHLIGDYLRIMYGSLKGLLSSVITRSFDHGSCADSVKVRRKLKRPADSFYLRTGRPTTQTQSFFRAAAQTANDMASLLRYWFLIP